MTASDPHVPERVTQGDPKVVVVRARRPPVVRLLRAAVFVLVVALVATSATVLVALPRVAVDASADRGVMSGGPMQVLIVGSDSRADLDAAERIELSTGSAGGERADTTMLLTLDGARAGILSFPRDLSVERCDGSVGRINGALAIGGPSCLVETVHRLSGIRAHHYLAVTFGGFRDVVDAVGGVELCLDRPISDRSAGIDLPEGCQVLDGADALGYVRVRRIDDDLARIGRQQRFLRALASELTDPTLMLRPWRIVAIAGGAARAVTVDDGLGPLDLAHLALGLRAVATGSVVDATVPVDGFTASSGAAMLAVRDAEAVALFEGFADGSALRTSAVEPAP